MTSVQARATDARLGGALSAPPSRHTRQRLLAPALTALVVVLFVANLSTGAFAIPAREVLKSLAVICGLGGNLEVGMQELAVLSGIRLPRAIMAAGTGAGLALAGAVLQGLFRNPLADPGVIGISSGAALGAAVAIVGLGLLPPAGRDLFGGYALPVTAFVFALITTMIVYRFGRAHGSTSVATMLLAGIAFNALALSGIGFLSFVASDERLRNLAFWNLGSVGGAHWRQLALCALACIPACALLLRMAAPLDALALGFAEARHIGVDVERLQWTVIVLSALLVGCLVASTGIIAFVGLIAPHIVRLAIGPAHSRLLPASALLGAALLLAADVTARTVFAPAELPVGILTTAAGAPFFLWLLLRSRREAFA